MRRKLLAVIGQEDSQVSIQPDSRRSSSVGPTCLRYVVIIAGELAWSQ